MKDLDQKILDKKGDFRVYSYEGSAVFKKPHYPGLYKHKDVLSAVKGIKKMREAGKYKYWQLVIIDFNTNPSRIIYVNNPPKSFDNE